MQLGWTSGEEQTVRDMCKAGCSAREIAAALSGRSRNSVIGYCHRKKIKLPREAPPRYPPGSGPERRRRAARKERRAVNQVLQTKYVPDPVILVEVDASWVSFWDLANHHCRWPGEREGQRVFCGREKFVGSSYCAEHTWQAQWHPRIDRRKFYEHHRATGINQHPRTKVGDSPE